MKKLTEYIVEKLSETSLFEMAYQRKEYMNKLFDLRLQLVENWALLRYCTLQCTDEQFNNLPDVSQTRNHWEKELKAHINNLNMMNLNVDKTRATYQELIEKAELNNTEKIISIIEFKFDVEGILNEDIIKIIAEDFVEYGLEELIEIICKKKLTVQELNEYVRNI